MPQHVHPVPAGEIDEPVGALPLPVDAIGPDHAPLHRVLGGDGIELARDEVQLRGDLLVERLVADRHADAKCLAKGLRESRGLQRLGNGKALRQGEAANGRDVAEQGAPGQRRLEAAFPRIPSAGIELPSGAVHYPASARIC